MAIGSSKIKMDAGKIGRGPSFSPSPGGFLPPWAAAPPSLSPGDSGRCHPLTHPSHLTSARCPSHHRPHSHGRPSSSGRSWPSSPDGHASQVIVPRPPHGPLNFRSPRIHHPRFPPWVAPQRPLPRLRCSAAAGNVLASPSSSALLHRRWGRPYAQFVCSAPPPPGTSARIPAPRPLSSSPVTPSRHDNSSS
jgi:hypothetical protein